LNIINDRKRLEIFFEDCLMAWFLWYAKFWLKTTKQDSYYTLETEDRGYSNTSIWQADE
jgi:hypothetical protein